MNVRLLKLRLSKTSNASYSKGEHKFDFIITLCVIGILATGLLYRLNTAQDDIEKVILSTEVNNLRLSLAESWVHKSFNNQRIDAHKLADSNPMLLIAETPNNYIGERATAPKELKAVWYFDIQKKRLVYQFNDGYKVQYKLVSTAGQSSASLLAIGGIDLVKDF